MKHIIKKLLVAILAALLAAGVFVPSASAVGGVWDYEYISNPDGSITITAYSGSGSSVAVPDKLGGRPVREIGAGVFAGHSEIEQIYIGNGVSVIGEGAFSGCTSLSELILPPSVEKIGERAFFGCTSLEEVDFAEGLREIGKSAFSDMALEYACLPATLEAVGDSAFAGGTPLKFIVAANPSPAAQYGAGCFSRAKIYGYAGSAAQNHAAGEQLVFSAIAPTKDFHYTILSRGVRITDCKSSAEAIVVPGEIAGKKVTAIGDGAFSANTNVKIIVLPDTIRTIGNLAFSGCASLEYIRTAHLGNIGQYAFKNCASLESIEIPRGVYALRLAFCACRFQGEACGKCCQ